MKYSLIREKSIKEVGTGLECGISIKDFIDFKEKDVIESYLAEEIQDYLIWKQSTTQNPLVKDS